MLSYRAFSQRASSTLRALALFTALAIGLAGAAHAQAPAPAAPAEDDARGKPGPVAPIPLTDILTHADEDQRVIERALRKVQEPNPSGPLGDALGEIARSVNAKRGNLSAEELRSLPVTRLESLDRHWRFDLRSFERWQAEMRQALQSYSDLAADLARRRAEWDATRASLTLSGVPSALVTRIDAVVAEITAAESKLSEPMSQLIELDRRGNVVSARIQAGRSDVAAAIANVDRRLMRRDAPVLWKVSPALALSDDSVQSIQQGLDVESRFAREYGNTMLVRGLRVLLLLMLPVLLWLAWRHKQAPVPEADENAQQVLSRPVSSWLLLSMLLTMAFETDAPLLVAELAMLIALVPLLRLLPREVLRALGGWPYVAVALFALDRVGMVFMANSYLYRVYQLGLAAVGLALTLWLLWRGYRRERSMAAAAAAASVSAGGAAPDDTVASPAAVSASGLRLRDWVRGFGWFCAAALGSSMLLNVAGNVSLAETLNAGLIDSSYIGLMLYAGVTVCIALLRALLAQPVVMKLRFARANAQSIQRLLSRGFALAALGIWLIYAMQSFRVLRPTMEVLTELLGTRYEIGELSLSLGNVLVFALSVVIAMWAARLMQVLLRDEVLGRMSLPRGVSNSVTSLTYYAVLVLGFLLALSAAGFKVSQLALVFGALGVGIGFGLQNVVNNFVSGFVLMFERPIQPGDVIDIAGVSGEVREIRMRATIIRTFDGADVVVPNGSLLSGNLVNWTLMDQSRRFEIQVGVAYASDPAQVLALLNDVARETPGVATRPPPHALMREFGPSALIFAVRAWTYDADNWLMIRSDMVMRILAALRAAGIEVPFPQQDLNVRTIDGAASGLFGSHAGTAAVDEVGPGMPPPGTPDRAPLAAPASPERK